MWSARKAVYEEVSQRKKAPADQEIRRFVSQALGVNVASSFPLHPQKGLMGMKRWLELTRGILVTLEFLLTCSKGAGPGSAQRL